MNSIKGLYSMLARLIDGHKIMLFNTKKEANHTPIVTDSLGATSFANY
jgi:hypothetical protein